MSEHISIADVIATTRPVDDYDGAVISSTTHVTKLDVVPASGVTVLSEATEMIVATLVMSACIATTIIGNVLVVLSVFTYRIHVLCSRTARDIFTFRSSSGFAYLSLNAQESSCTDLHYMLSQEAPR